MDPIWRISMEYLCKSVCRWCGRQGKTAYSIQQRLPNQPPFVAGVCKCHPSGRPNMPHSPQWETFNEPFSGREFLYRAICQWCGKQGETAYSVQGRTPNHAPSVQGVCHCHPSGKSGMPHAPRWERL